MMREEQKWRFPVQQPWSVHTTAETTTTALKPSATFTSTTTTDCYYGNQGHSPSYPPFLPPHLLREDDLGSTREFFPRRRHRSDVTPNLYDSASPTVNANEDVFSNYDDGDDENDDGGGEGWWGGRVGRERASKSRQRWEEPERRWRGQGSGSGNGRFIGHDGGENAFGGSGGFGGNFIHGDGAGLGSGDRDSGSVDGGGVGAYFLNVNGGGLGSDGRGSGGVGGALGLHDEGEKINHGLGSCVGKPIKNDCHFASKENEAMEKRTTDGRKRGGRSGGGGGGGGASVKGRRSSDGGETKDDKLTSGLVKERKGEIAEEEEEKEGEEEQEEEEKEEEEEEKEEKNAERGDVKERIGANGESIRNKVGEKDVVRMKTTEARKWMGGKDTRTAFEKRRRRATQAPDRQTTVS